MLPDYPKLKAEIADLLNRFANQRVADHQGFVGRVARHRIFEGDSTSLRRSTGEVEAKGFEEVGGLLKLSADEIPTMTLHDVLAKLDAVAAEIGEKTARSFMADLDKTLEAAGQVDGAKGQGISPQRFLQALERIEMDFDETGKHRELSLVMHPNNAAAMEAALHQLDDDPGLRERYRELIERKREAWRAREASRRLVG
jgi:hypothetical protein